MLELTFLSANLRVLISEKACFSSKGSLANQTRVVCLFYFSAFVTMSCDFVGKLTYHVRIEGLLSLYGDQYDQYRFYY